MKINLDLLKGINIREGGHASPEDGLCVMEAVAYVAGEKHSDHPKCADQKLTELCIDINDSLHKRTQFRTKLLKPLIPKLIRTKTKSKKIQNKRKYYFIDKLLHNILPIIAKKDHKNFLKELPRVRGKRSFKAANKKLKTFFKDASFYSDYVDFLASGISTTYDAYPFPRDVNHHDKALKELVKTIGELCDIKHKPKKKSSCANACALETEVCNIKKEVTNNSIIDEILQNTEKQKQMVLFEENTFAPFHEKSR